MVELLYKELTFAVMGAAMEVHKILGPGFLEAVYQAALARELTFRGIPFEQQVRLPALLLNFGTGSLEHRRVIK